MIEVEEILEVNSRPVVKVFDRPDSLSPLQTSFCFGCTYGIIGRIFSEVIDELGIANDVILVAGNGCYGSLYVNVDGVGSPHGRAPAIATALKRLYPEKIVFTFQGDGDLCSEGVSEAVNAAWRGERIGIFWFNNSSIAMTGAQMAPTSIIGMKTSTTPEGRDAVQHGHPMKMTEMLALSPGVVYASRTSVHNPTYIMKAKKEIRTAFEHLMRNEGMVVLETLSTCNSGWKMTPVKALEWLEDNMIPSYPLGQIK